jgi:GMP synthase (glutamine-hydrolysing)
VPFQSAEEAFAPEAEGRDPVRRPGLGARRQCAAARRWRFTAGVPVLGICYGQQTMAQQLGGKVEAAITANSAAPSIEITETCALFEGVWEVGGVIRSG